MSITGSQNLELAEPVWYIIHGVVVFRSVWCPDTLRVAEERELCPHLEKPKTGDSPIQTVATPSHPRCSDNSRQGMVKLFRSGLGNQLEGSLLWGSGSGLQLIISSTDPKQTTNSRLLWILLAHTHSTKKEHWMHSFAKQTWLQTSRATLEMKKHENSQMWSDQIFHLPVS